MKQRIRKVCSISRREFISGTLAVSILPFPNLSNHDGAVEMDRLFQNFSPCKQVLTAEIVSILSQCCGVNLLKGIAEKGQRVRFAQMLRRKLRCIQVEAACHLGESSRVEDQIAVAWLAGSGAKDRILRLEAFVRSGCFSVCHSGSVVSLTMEQ